MRAILSLALGQQSPNCRSRFEPGRAQQIQEVLELAGIGKKASQSTRDTKQYFRKELVVFAVVSDFGT
jgi:hypothetical protein